MPSARVHGQKNHGRYLCVGTRVRHMCHEGELERLCLRMCKCVRVYSRVQGVCVSFWVSCVSVLKVYVPCFRLRPE